MWDQAVKDICYYISLALQRKIRRESNSTQAIFFVNC
jgi:hypothetical protein